MTPSRRLAEKWTRRRFLAPALLLLIAALVCPASVYAQLPPQVGYIHPAGGQAGTTVDVLLAGFDWTPDMQYFFHDPRIQLEIVGELSEVLNPDPPYWFGKKARDAAMPLPREIAAKITIPADVPAGPILWQVANANGASASGQFIVSRTNELVEDHLRAAAAKIGRFEVPQLPELPVIINGRVKRIEEVDRYRFVAAKTGPVSVELFARRIGSPLDGVLEVYDAVGNRIVDVAGTAGRDLAATFVAEQGQEYTLHLYDIDFRGDRACVYRLELTPGPCVIAASPSGGQRGTTQNVTFTGYGLATGSAALESITQPITFPTDPAIVDWKTTLTTPFGDTPEFTLFVDDFANVTKPDNSTDAMPLTLPTAATGTIGLTGADRYTLTGKMGDVWSLEVSGSNIGSPVDPTLAILGPDGNELARNDDAPGRTDAVLAFTVPADGTYQLVVADMGNPDVERPRTYRLTATSPRPGYDVTLPEFQTVLSGGSAELALAVARHGGFTAPITVGVSGLPEGYTAPQDLVVPEGAAELKIPISVDAAAAVTASLVTVTTKAAVNGQETTRTSPPVLIAGTMTPPFSFDGDGKDDVTKWRRGTRFPAPVTIERKEGFTGEITFVMTARQSRHRMGIWGPELTIPGDVSHFKYPIYLPEWLETTRTSRMILNGWAEVPDPKGNVRYLQAKMATRIGFLPIGALFKIDHEPREYELKPGEAFDVALTLSRSSELTAGTTVELVLDEEQQGLFTAEPLTIPADQTAAVFRIQTAADSRLEGEYAITLRATTHQPGDLPVISETIVTVAFPR